MGRFVAEGRMKAVLVTAALASNAAPTQAEIAAGTELVGDDNSEAMVEIIGFQVQNNTIATPSYASLTVGNVAGQQTVPDSAMEWYKDDTDETIYSAVAAGTTGWIILMHDGIGAGEESEVWPVSVSTRPRLPQQNAAHRFRANYATGAPIYGTQAA